MTQDLTRTFLSSGVIELRVLVHIVVMDSDLKTKMYKCLNGKNTFFLFVLLLVVALFRFVFLFFLLNELICIVFR